MIRDNVKLICKAKGMQLGDICDALKITRQTLHTYLTGSPTTATLQKIADVLNVPPFVLLHPAPLTALRMEAGGLEAGRMETQQTPTIICPHCGKRITITATANQDDAGQNQKLL